MSGIFPSVRAKTCARICVDRSKTGRPDRPPVSVFWRSARVAGRDTVVFDTISPSDAARERDAHDIVELGLAEVRRDLEEQRAPHALVVARFEHPREKFVERRRFLQVAQSRACSATRR